MDPNVARLYRELKQEWKRSRPDTDSGIGVYMHPAYQAIIGLGSRALPLILRDLDRELDHWFWALRAITREDPCIDEIRGDLTAMREAWRTWAVAQNIEW